MTTPRILYFDIRGRVEALRLIFEDLAIAYRDDRVRGADWRQLKPTLPFGKLPLYEEDGLTMVESRAILRHVARTRGLWGRDEAEHVTCEMTAEAIADLLDLLGQYQWRPDRETMRLAFVSDELSPRLGLLERWFAARGSEVHWVGDQPTYADYLAFHALDQIEAFFPDALKAQPRLEAYQARFAQQPRIAAYLASGRRPAAFAYGPDGLLLDPRI